MYSTASVMVPVPVTSRPWNELASRRGSSSSCTPSGWRLVDLDARLARFHTLTLDTDTLFRVYHQPAMRARRERQQRGANEPPAGSDVAAAGSPRSAGVSMADGPAPATAGDADRNDRLVLAELSEARLLRAIYSERQLEEVLTDFWFNHFNVFAGKGLTRAFVTAFERDAIRPHVLGDFRTMLEEVAKSPAMLFYLDNWMNVSPQTGPQTRRPQRQQTGTQADQTRGPQRTQTETQTDRTRGPQKAQTESQSGLTLQPQIGVAQAGRPPRATRGINENFARELLELHTLGVDGGYTQADIVDIARAFTGWTMRPRQGSGFVFTEALHDRGEKTVLGRTIKAGGGIEDGQRVLDILVAHPSTARFIAAKLAQRFVSDAPPPALVDRAARRFSETGGNLREVTRTIITSPEFLSPSVHRAKVKTPLEFVVSALRATGASVRSALPMVRTLRDLGMPLYFCQPPTGYEEAAETWVSSGALVARLNFALDLAGGRLRGVTLPGANLTPASPGDVLIADILGGNVSASTRATVAKTATHEQALALIIGSPEFQRQ